MSRLACCVVLAVCLCTVSVQVVNAQEIQTAKVYREYPGYIETPTCVNPRLSGQSAPTAETGSQSWNCPYSWSFTPMVGYQTFDGDLDVDDNVSVGMAIGYNLTSNWALEADVRYTPTNSSSSSDVDVDVWTLSGGALYHFLPEQRLNPYLSAGLGGIIYSVKHVNDDQDYMGYWGGGLKYAINRTISLRVDVRDIIDYRSDDRFNSQDGPNWCHSLSAMAGVTFQLGR